MNFRIADLLALTALCGILAFGFCEDVMFFRQLLWFSVVAMGSTLFVLAFQSYQRASQWTGALGGLFGGLIFLGFDYLVICHVREITVPPPGPVYFSAFEEWILAIVPVAFVSLILGVVIGPLLSFRFNQRVLPKKFVESIRYSVLLLAVAFLFTSFDMLHRVAQTYASPDRSMLIIPALVVFWAYTFAWQRCFFIRPK